MHAFGEEEASAALAWADFDDDVAELAVAARLLLVPAVHGDHLADRLAIGDGGLAGFDLHAEAVVEPFDRHSEMHLALAIELHFARFLVLDVAERGILLGELGERGGDAHLVLAVLDMDCDGLGGRRRRNLDGRRGRGLAVDEAVAGLDAVEFLEREGVALFGARNLLRGGAHQAHQAGRALLGAA